MLRGRRLPLPQSPRSGWRTTASVSARLFSTTAPRLDDNRHDDRPPAEGAQADKEQQGRLSEAKPLFTKIQVSGDDWALLHSPHGGKANPKHVHLSLEGLRPFGAKHRDQFRAFEAASILAGQEARRRRGGLQKAQGGDGRLPQSALRQTKGSQETKKGNYAPPRAFRHSDGSQDGSGRNSLSWRSIMHRNKPGRIDKRDQSSTEGQKPSSSGRRSRPNELKITITPQQEGARLNSQETGKLKKATVSNLGFQSWEVTPQKEAINRQVRVTAAGMTSISTLRPLDPVEQSPRYTLPPPKPQDARQDVGEFVGAAAAMGPAESVRGLLAEDPILKEAELLSKKRVGPAFFSQSPPKLDMKDEPRFRVLPTWQWFQRKNAKLLDSKSSQSEPESLGSARISNVSIETEAQQEQNQESQVKASSSQPGTAKATALQETEGKIYASNPTPSKDGGNTAREPVKPAQPERSIFEQLFLEERPRGNDYWRIADRLRSAFSAVEEGPGSDAELEREAPAWTQQPGQSIFGQLFPEEVVSRSGESEEGVRRPSREPLTPPKDSLMVSLRNEVRSWIPEDQQDRITGPQPGEYGSHSTVVVISGTSPSLIDTDFYRIAPEGRHVEGWAGGLVKVVQACDSVTLEPLGQYYLMFHSRPSALAYVDEVRRLHTLSRKLLHAPAASGKQVAKGALDQAPATPQPFLTDEEKAAVRSFTLLSPSLPPRISVRLWNTRLVADIASKSNIADVVQALRPEATTPAKVLLKIRSSSDDGGDDPGGGLTTDELWLTLRDDGRERSAPWVLASLSRGIMPVRSRFTAARSGIKVRAQPVPVALELEDEVYDVESGEPVAGELPSAADRSKEKLGGGADRHERFNRFVLTFTQPAIARRFVRCWHKRAIYDAVLRRTVVVDAVALM